MIRLYFITSSQTKLAHARHLARAYLVNIREKRNYGVAYNEPRLSDRDELLRKSYDDALARWKKSAHQSQSFFFLEDTSVIIDALSENREYPGLDVKYWMREITFAKLDKLLRDSGNNRRVTVRSDAVLHLPEAFRAEHSIEDRFLVFTGMTTGAVVEQEGPVTTNILYPWLDSRSFNKWFAPTGCDSPLSSLPIEVADAYDFRAGSIGGLLQFLRQYSEINTASSVRPADRRPHFARLLPALQLVTGLPCAGKTTLGTYLSEKCGYYHIEASDFMKLAFFERHGRLSKLSVEEFAENALIATPDIVVRPVIREIMKCKERLIIVTGFRSPREIEIFRAEYDGPSDVESWFIQANESVRFNRSVERDRADALESIDSFQKRDEVQLRMGLETIHSEIGSHVIVNESSLTHFFSECVRLFDAVLNSEDEVPAFEKRPSSLEETVLIGLLLREADGNPLYSTTELAHELNQMFPESKIKTNKNNVSRFFNQRVSAYFKFEEFNGVLKYRLSATGRSRALRQAAKRYHDGVRKKSPG